MEERRVLSVDVVDGQAFTIAENSQAGTVVGTPVVTQSAPAQPLTFAITAGNDANAFLINPVSGEISVNDPALLDFETEPNWGLTVEASLTGNPSIRDAALVSISLTDVFAPAQVTLGGGSATLAVNNGLLTVVQGSTTLFSARQEDVSALAIIGSAAADQLIVDFSGGNPLPVGGLTYDGLGQPAGTVDSLALVGTSFDSAAYRYDNAHDGGISLTTAGVTSSIEYRNLEPLVNTGIATDVVFTLSASTDHAVLEDLGGGLLRLRSTDAVPTFESTTFAAPTNSLSVKLGDGNDTLTVTPLSGAFSVSVDGEAGDNTLIVDEADAPAVAPTFQFAGFAFLQTGTPDVAQALGGPLDGGFGVVVTAQPGPVTGDNVFPDTLAGFDSSLSIGRLLNPGLSSGTLATNLPSTNVGTIVRSGIVLSWSGGRTLTDQAGDDFVIYESSSNVNGPDAAMVQVHIAGGGWTKWRYEAPDSRAPYGGVGTAGAFATAFDLADFGLTAGQAIDSIRYVNMTAADRMEGPGAERVAGDGVLVASGFVIPNDNGATSNVLPDPGATASFAYYGNSTFDPDPLYFGVLHPLATSGGANPDIVTVTNNSIAVNHSGVSQPTIGYLSIKEVDVNTHGGADQITVAVGGAGMPTTLRLDGGDPTSLDRVTVQGTTGGQTFALRNNTVSDGTTTLFLANLETAVIDVTAAGTGDNVSVDRSFTLAGTAPRLQVRGGGAGQNDTLSVDTEFDPFAAPAPQTYSFASVSFDQNATPNLFSELGNGLLDGGQGVTITTRPLSSGPASGTITGFPNAPTAGFNSSLSLGALWERAASATPRFVSLPDGTNDGNTARAGFVLGWDQGRTLADAAGNDFVLYESGYDGLPDAQMVQVHNADTGVWSQWVYRQATSSANYGGAVAFATQFDLSADFGAATIDAIRVVNMTAADRVTSATGQGTVAVGGGPGTFQPLIGPLGAPNTTFTATEFDPDPLYLGVSHVLGSATSRNDVVAVNADSVDLTGFMALDHSGLTQLTLDTGGGADTISVTPSADTAFVIHGGSPSIATNPGDRLTLNLAGLTTPVFTLSGLGAGTLTSNRQNVVVDGIDSLGATSTMKVVVSEAANTNGVADDAFSVTRNAASDEITVNGSLALRVDRAAVGVLQFDGSAANDALTVDFTNGDPVPTGGIIFNAAAGGSDTLVYTGGGITTVTQRYDNADDGNTTVDGSSVAYFGVDGITDNLLAANRNFSYTAAGNTIDLGDDVPQAGRSLITSDHGAATKFANPSATLTVNAGPANDIVTLGRLDAAFAAAIALNGQAGDDDIALDNNGRAIAGGSVDWIKFPLTIDGGGQTEDRLTIDDTGSTRDKTYTVSNVQIGGGVIPAGAAVATPSGSPNVNGTIDGAEWDQVPYAFDSGARPAPDQQSILHFTFSAGAGTTVADTTGNNNTGLLVEPVGPQFRVGQGKFGGALEFDGVDDFAWFKDPAFDVGTTGTLNFWVKMDNTARRNQFFEGPGNAGFEFQYRETSGGQFYGRTTTVGGDFVIRSGPDNSANGVWTNLQYTWDFATKQMHIYRDGVESSYLANSTPFDLTWGAVVSTVNQMMNMGRDPGDATRYFDGKMDDVAWFNSVLSATERDALRTQSVAGAQADTGGGGANASGRLNAIGVPGGKLVAYWNMDNAPGTTDVAGNGGTTIVLHTTPPVAQFVAGGKFGGALDFDGQDGFATFQDPSFDVGASGTLNFWVNMDDQSKRNQFFEGPGNDVSFEFQYRTNSSGQFYARANNGGDFIIQSGNAGGTTGTWINLQYTWDFATKQMHIYRNGTEVSYLATNNQNIDNWNSVFSTINQVINVGRDPGDPTRMFDGRMDDIAWFNTVLNATERDGIRLQSVGVAQGDTGAGGANAAGRLNSVTAATPGNLAAYWNLDDVVGTTLAPGDGGTNITLKIGPQTEGAAYNPGGGPTLPAGGPPLNSVVFDGNLDFIRAADSTSLDFNKSKGTIAFWVKPEAHAVDNNAATGYTTLVEDTNQQVFVGISYQQNAGAAFGNADFYNRIVFSPFENTPSANQNIVVSNTRLTAGQWTHVTVTWDFTTHTAAIYLNGQLDTTVLNNTSNPAVWTQAAGNTGDWIFGADGKTQAHALTGEMADIALYGSALRASEVRSLYQTGAANSGSFDLAGAKGRFTWDDTYLYGLIESYPPGGGNSNGPFDNLELELFINNGTTLAARLDHSVLVPVNNIAGSAVLPAGTDVQLYEFKIPLAAINDGVQAFDPTTGDFLRYRVRTIDGDVAGSGFDTRDTTLGWVVEPPLTSDNLRRMDFAKSENFFGVGGRLTYTNFAHLTLNAGDGVDNLTVVDSQLAVPATNPTKTFTLNMGDGADVVTIASIDSAFNAAVTIDGQAGTDGVTIDAPLALGSALSTGNLLVSAENIALNQTIDTTAGTVGDVTFHVGTLLTAVVAADIRAGGDFLADGATYQTSADVTTLGGNITFQGPTTLTGDVTLTSAGGDVRFAGPSATLDGGKNLTIDADAGDIAFDAAVGNGTPLVDVLIQDAHDLDIGAAFAARSFTHLHGTGATTFAGATTLSEAVGTALALSTPTVVVDAPVQSAGGEFSIAADQLDLNAGGSLNVTSLGLITIVTLTPAREIELGGNTATRLALDAAELTRITADTLRIGDASSSNIDLSAPVVVGGVLKLHLITSGDVGGAGTVTVARLAVEALGDVNLSNANDVDLLAIQVAGPGKEISFRDIDDLLLADVDGVGGIETVGGDATLRTGGLLAQNVFGSIVVAGLELLGTGPVVLGNPTNDADTLAASLDGPLVYNDIDDLIVGTVQTFGSPTAGITTTADDVTLQTVAALSLQDAIDVQTADILLASFTGAIDDIGPTTTKITAANLGLAASTGIGVTQALKTDVGLLAAQNFSSGRIAIDDRSGAGLTVAPFAGLPGLVNFGAGGTSLTHTGPLAIDGPVVDFGGGVTLVSQANGGDDDHLTLNSPLMVLGGTGDIVLTAGTDLLLNDTGILNDVQTTGSGSIFGTAGRDVVIGPDVRIRSATGAIENIPPLLTNVSGPQIAATGDALVKFDYGRLQELNFTATVDWSDGGVDVVSLFPPGTAFVTHNYTGNPNLADPAAPIPVTVMLQSDSRIHFTGYEFTTVVITLDFPGIAVHNVRIDTTIKVHYLTAGAPERLAGATPLVTLTQIRSNVYTDIGAAADTAATADRVVILREVLPDGQEGSAVRFSQEALDDLPALFKKLRNGRYRVYLFEPETQTLRMVVEVYVRGGKPVAPDAAGDALRNRPDGAQIGPPAKPAEQAVTSDIEPADRRRAVLPAVAAATAGAGLVLAGDRRPWADRVDAALEKFRKFSRVRPQAPRRRMPR